MDTTNGNGLLKTVRSLCQKRTGRVFSSCTAVEQPGTSQHLHRDVSHMSDTWCGLNGKEHDETSENSGRSSPCLKRPEEGTRNMLTTTAPVEL